MVNKSGAIYWFQCSDLTCKDEYTGETSRTFGERFKEHLKYPSPIHHHRNNTGHPITQQNFQIGSEGHGLARNIKESIFSRVYNPSLNKNVGKFNEKSTQKVKLSFHSSLSVFKGIQLTRENCAWNSGDSYVSLISWVRRTFHLSPIPPPLSLSNTDPHHGLFVTLSTR